MDGIRRLDNEFKPPSAALTRSRMGGCATAVLGIRGQTPGLIHRCDVGVAGALMSRNAAATSELQIASAAARPPASASTSVTPAPSRGSDDHHSGSGRRARPTCAGETTISRTANVVCESLGRRHLRPEVRCRLIGAQRGDAQDRRVRPGWREPVSGFGREHLRRSHRRHDVTPAAPSHATVTRLQGHRDRRRGRGDLVQHPQVGHRVAALTRGDRADERRDR